MFQYGPRENSNISPLCLKIFLSNFISKIKDLCFVSEIIVMSSFGTQKAFFFFLRMLKICQENPS